ncbi:MAG: sugar phosphate isomerase/epimerase family protein [Ramlibacter sp.]
MRIALCNEVLAGMPLEKQCEYAAGLGYDGLEVAPFTLSDAPEKISSARASDIRATVESFGLVITGLHWLLVKPEGLSLTTPDAQLRRRTLEVMDRLCGLCAELGGKVLVHGSPKQRQVAPGETHATALGRLQEGLAHVAKAAASHDVVYCIEPLSKKETDVLNTVAQAAQVVRAIGHASLRTMIDCSAAGQTETVSVPELIDLWLPTGLIGHVQVNDPNRRGPGQGEMKFAPIFEALKRNGYEGAIGVEPFDYVPDGPGVAAFSAGYLRAVREAL